MLMVALLLSSTPQGSAPPVRLREPGSVTIERRGAAMGTTIRISVEAANRSAALSASEVAFGAILRAQERLSTWVDGGELARLNASPAGAPFALSPELARDLARCERWWRDTDGAFDPSVGALVEVWGLRDGGRWPSPTDLDIARGRSGWWRVSLVERSLQRQVSGLSMEEGGFGKGAGLEDALAALGAIGALSANGANIPTSALLDLGGQIALFGNGEHRLPLADPRDRQRPVVELLLDGGSIATSGNSERSKTTEGGAIGHVLDPHTGRPAATAGSITVWTPSPLDADCLSTALFVMGPEKALAWAEERARAADAPAVDVLILAWSGNTLHATATAGFRGRLRPLDTGVSISFPAPRPSAGGAPGIDPTDEVREPR